MAGYQGWQQQLLTSLGAPATSQNLTFLNDWQRAEGGSASFNPMNTTQPFQGASSYNSVGVRNYPTAAAGLSATKQTLLNGHYANIVGDLRSGKASAQQLATDVANSPWGTGSGVLRVLGSKPTNTTNVSSAAPQAKAPAATLGSGPSAALNPLAMQLLQQSSMSGAGGQTAADIGNNLLSMAMARQQAGAAQQVYGQGNSTIKTPSGLTVKGVNPNSPHDANAVKMAENFVGTPYVWGGASPKGFDCSGLLQYVWGKQGVNIPRTTYDQWSAGQAVNPQQLKPGDAVFFKGSDSKTVNGQVLPGHVGMYIGAGKFIQAPHTGSTVQISTLANEPGFMGARRFA